MTDFAVTINCFPPEGIPDAFWVHVESPAQADKCFAALPADVPRINLDSLEEVLVFPTDVSGVALLRTPSPTFQEFIVFVHSVIVPALDAARISLERVILITDMYGGHSNGCCNNATIQDDSVFQGRTAAVRIAIFSNDLCSSAHGEPYCNSQSQ